MTSGGRMATLAAAELEGNDAADLIPAGNAGHRSGRNPAIHDDWRRTSGTMGG